MGRNLEVIFDSNPSEGCGCNCGCGGSNVIDDINNLVDNLKEHYDGTELKVNSLPISDLEVELQIEKINRLLDNTNAVFRVDEETLEEALTNMLPLTVLDDNILTAYGVPTLYDVVQEVDKQ